MNVSVMEEKIWGWVTHIFHSPFTAVSYLKLIKGYRCSQHCHIHRVNQFNLLSGKVLIEEWHGFRIRETIMNPGDSIEVMPNVFHRFTVLENGEMIEVYYTNDGTAVDVNDIERKDTGGLVE